MPGEISQIRPFLQNQRFGASFVPPPDCTSLYKRGGLSVISRGKTYDNNCSKGGGGFPCIG